MIMGAISVILLVAADQITKWLVRVFLKRVESVTLIKGVLELRYLENSGAAWGMMNGSRVLFIIAAIVISALLIFYYARIPIGKRYRPMKIAFVALAAGAIGNMIDRLLNGYVVDFIYFRAINFPIFNFADICVSLSAILLVLLILFYYKEDELAFFRISKKEAK